MLGSMMPSNRRVIAFAAALIAIGVGVGVAVDRAAFAQQPSNGIKRTILQRADEPGAPNYEAVMAIAEIAPGASSGRHRHPGIELAYVLEGSLVVEREGLPSGLEVTASTSDAVIMGLKVKGAETWGVQFHPESILTRQGKDLLRNFLDHPDHIEARKNSFSTPHSNMADLGQIKQPVLIIHGRYDRMVAFEVSIAILNHVADSRLVLLNDCGHWPPFEKPAEWAAHVLTFLRGY